MVSSNNLELYLCRSGENITQLNFDKYDKCFSVPLYFHGVQGYYVFFDPWTGLEISGTFEVYAENLDITKNKWEQEINSEMRKHIYPNVCTELSWFLKGGNEEGLTPIIHIPNIRVYAILNKKKYGGWTAMDYCPFCGAKFPSRLDEELTRILQDEYSLESWKNYKKAPHEFHTDEWWKKRGL